MIEKTAEPESVPTATGRFRGALARLRSKPSSVTEGQARSWERYRRAGLTSIGSAAAKFISILTVLISVPLTIRYLGLERYGVWMTIASTVTMLSSADLGIGNGLLTLVSEANGADDTESARKYVSSAFYMLSGIAVLLLAAALLSYPFLHWEHLFNVSGADAVRETGPTFLVVFACLALNIPLGIAQRVQGAYQEGYISNLWQILGTVLSLAAVIVAIRLHASLPLLVLGFAGAPVLALLLNTIWLFAKHKRWLMPSFSAVDGGTAIKLFRLGVMFFVLQLGLAVGFQSDNLVLARMLGPSAVAQYAPVVRMFSILPVVLNFTIMPLWPAYGEAFARGDVAWLKKALSRSIGLVLVASAPLNLLLVVSGKWMLRMWVGPQLHPSLLLLSGIAVSQTLMAVATAGSVFLNALNVLKFQAYCFTAMAVVNISASVYLTSRVGIPGVVYGSVVAQALCWIVPAWIFFPKFMASLDRSTKIAVAEIDDVLASAE